MLALHGRPAVARIIALSPLHSAAGRAGQPLRIVSASGACAGGLRVSHSYEDVLKQDFTPIRKELTAYLSNKRGYYKYLRGEWPLMPEQQQYIEEVFRRYGYEGKVVYDRTEYVFILEAVPY